MEQSAAVKKFVARIKSKYIERRLNRERQWPPCKSEKLVRLELVEGEQRQGYSASQTRGKGDKAIKRSPLAYSDILKAKDGERRVRKVLVEGDAGIGKTTLCTALSEDWANKKLFQEFEILLLLHLRQNQIASAGSLLGLLKLLHSSSEICTLVAKYIEDQNEGKVLIVADGWDELSTEDRSEGSFLYELLFGECYSLSVVVTSRPSASVPFHDLRCIDRFVEVRGFSRDNIKEFIQCEFDDDRAKGLLAQLEGNPLIESVCSVPLNCAIICHLWDCFDGALPTTMSKLYTNIILNVILRNIRKKSEYKSIPSLPHFDSLPDSLQQPWSLLCELAFQTLSEDKIVFSHKDLAMRFKGLTLDSGISCFGLLQSAESVLVDGYGVSFHFLHLTFQEYLAALYLVRQPTDTQLQLCRSLAESKHLKRFEMVWRFFFGLSFSVCNKPVGVDVSKLLVDNTITTLSLCHFALEANYRAINDLITSRIIVRNVEFKARVAFDSVAVIHFITNLLVCHHGISIILSDCGLRGEQITALADALAGDDKNLRVETIDLSGNRLTDESLAILFERASPTLNQSLRSVNLSNNIISLKTVDSLTSILVKSFSVIMQPLNPKFSFDDYTQLDISDNPLGIDGCKALRDVLFTNRLTNLQHLSLAGSLTSDAEANAELILALGSSGHWILSGKLGIPGRKSLDESLSHLLLGSRLRDLIISYLHSLTGSGDLKLQDLILSHLHSGSSDLELRDLILSHLYSGSDYVGLIHWILLHLYSGSDHLYSLESLDLSRNNLGVPGGKAVGKILSNLHCLRTLILTETMLGNEGVAAFIKNLKDTVSHQLGSLYLDNNGIQAAGISYLAKSVCTGRLRLTHGYFTLAKNPLGLEGIIDVVKILISDHFQAGYIDLSGCQLTTAGGSATNHDLSAVGVQQLICSQQLQATHSSLMIDNNNFSGEGIHILATFMYACQENVYELSCRSCGITSNRFKQLLVLLSELKIISSCLYSWDFSNNDIDDDGVSALIQHLSMFPALSSTDINLNGNIQISPGMVEALNEELRAREVH